MPVPAEADAKKAASNAGASHSTTTTSSTSTSTSSSPNARTSSSNTGVPASPAPPAPVSAPHNDKASSLGAEENCLASSNGGPGATSPIDVDQPHKIFVGGLSWQTSEDKLREIFEGYGEVTEYNIMKDPVTKKSRGFGFITFKSTESVRKVLEMHICSPISIDEKTIDPKVAIPPKRLSNKVKRIFVGGLSSDSCDEDLKEYFTQFGRVMESQLMYDRNTSRHRGFGFVTFEHEEPAEKVCSIQYHDIKGKKVEVKVAQTKEALAMQHGRGRVLTQRNYSSAYGNFPGHGYTQFYPPHHYPLDLMNMGGYSATPVIIPGGGGGGKLGRGGSKARSGGYPQYPTAYAYGGPGGGWGDHAMGGGYYGPGYGVQMPMMRGHLAMDPSAVEYMAEQFQGMSMGGAGYFNHSPPSGSQFGNMDHVTTTGSYSPPHNLSPKGGVVTSSGINGYSSVPTYSGNHTNSYAVAQPSY